jgi:hypothetical protein
MSEITIGTIIKIILGLLVVAAVAYALYYLFSNYIMGSFKDLGLNTTVDTSVKLILAVL